VTVIGPHLLGRLPSPPDPRDFKLADFKDASPLDVALAKLLASPKVAPATKQFGKAVVAYINAMNPPEPPPIPTPDPTTEVFWTNPRPLLNQGDTPHCVGFSGAHWGNTLPVGNVFEGKDGDAMYYECKMLDGEPGAENGTYVRSLAKVLTNRGRVGAYAFAEKVDELRDWVRSQGPVIVGTTWYDDMFYPDPAGFITPTGPVAGGHAYLLVGDRPESGTKPGFFIFLNSWGVEWGQQGYFKITHNDFGKLLEDYGEACVTLELPL
jgi:hypothetical protein